MWIAPLLLLACSGGADPVPGGDVASPFDALPAGPPPEAVGATVGPDASHGGRLVVLDVAGTPTWGVQPWAPCAAGACLGTPVALGGGFDAAVLGLIDLGGSEVVVIPSQSPRSAGLPKTLPDTATAPVVAVLRGFSGQGTSLHSSLALVGTREGEGVVWEEVLQSGGYTTIGDIRFVPEPGGSMAIGVRQSSSGGDHPGPPQTFWFRPAGTDWSRDLEPPPGE